MLRQDDPVRIRCGIAVDEEMKLAGTALVCKARLRQADTPDREELRELIAPYGGGLDVDDTASVVGVER